LFNNGFLFSLHFTELLSPSPSSCADISSPDLQRIRRYPRGIINPNYPGFQHLAHTLAEHFIDHHQFEQSSDSEISEDFDFDVAAYRNGNLGNVNIMSEIDDSNNNNDNIDTVVADGPDKNIDLNRNKNRRSSFSMSENAVNDFGPTTMMMKESLQLTLTDKEYGNGNDNLLLSSEPKVFCESKQLGFNETQLEFERFSSEDEDEECCNVSTNVVNNFKEGETGSSRMDFDDDDIADLSGEDDAAIKNELENIDKAGNDFNENINCDLATYLQQYDFKMDLKKSYRLVENDDADEECLTDEDNSKLPTPDILIEHSNKKLQNSETAAKENINGRGSEKQSIVDVSLLLLADDAHAYQPDLIKNITDTVITTSDKNQRGDEQQEDTGKIRCGRMRQSGKGDNGISSPAEHEIPTNNERKTNDDDKKIINQVQTETVDDGDDERIEVTFNEKMVQVASKNVPLSFESATSTNIDIIGDFGKEIEKEIGLIVSGYRKATNEMCSGESSKKTLQSIRPVRTQQPELVFDENKFIEHLKYFSKVSQNSGLSFFFTLLSLVQPFTSS
jgi:hypothetical protein